MKGYVKTLEAIIASIALVFAFILSVNLLNSRRDLGLIKKSDTHSVENYVYGVIEYLAITGELSTMIYNSSWDVLRNRLDELLATRGIGYRLIVYLIISNEKGGNMEQKCVIVSNFDPSNAGATSIYYYIPPSFRDNSGYLLEIKISW